MKKKIILVMIVVIMITCCCSVFCSCDKAEEKMQTYVEIKCESNDSVFYLTFVPGVDEIRLNVPELAVDSAYLTVFDSSTQRALIDCDVDMHWQTIDKNGIVHSILGTQWIGLGEVYAGSDTSFSAKRLICYWDITFKKTGETRRVTLIAEKQ